MTDEFFMVECSGVFGQSLYKMYHAVATLDKADPIQHDRIQRKRERWENVGRKIRRPPNILVISQDSTSRLNLRRFMNKTVNILNSLGAVEMLGYSSGKGLKYANISMQFLNYITFQSDTELGQI